MISLLLWLVFLLQPALGDFSTKLKPHYAGNLRTTCDTLPYRTVYHETQSEANCYFVIEADVDSVQTAEKCSRVQKGAKLAGNAPDSVYSKVFANKSEFLQEGESTGKKMKAMCVYGSKFPCASGLKSGDSGTCIRPEEQKLEARLLNFYRSDFTKPVVPGQTIVVRGFSSGIYQMTPLSISLKGDDYMKSFHFSILADSNVRGLWIWQAVNFQWIEREKQVYPWPFGHGVSYEVRIRVLEDGFQIFINGKEYGLKSKPELLKSTITNLIVGTSSESAYISYIDLGENTDPYPPPRGLIYDFPICQEKCNWKFCKSLVISGIFGTFDDPNINPNDFYFNLASKTGDWILHVRCWFPNGCGINTKLNGQWGTHVAVNGMPFKRKERFEITITTGAEAFEIAVNSKHFASFPHRMSPNKIARIETSDIENVDFQIK